MRTVFGKKLYNSLITPVTFISLLYFLLNYKKVFTFVFLFLLHAFDTLHVTLVLLHLLLKDFFCPAAHSHPLIAHDPTNYLRNDALRVHIIYLKAFISPSSP